MYDEEVSVDEEAVSRKTDSRLEEVLPWQLPVLFMNRLESSQLARYEDRHASDHGGEVRVDREERRVDVGLQEGGETVHQQQQFEVTQEERAHRRCSSKVDTLVRSVRRADESESTSAKA